MTAKQRDKRGQRRTVTSTNPLTVAGEEFRRALLDRAAVLLEEAYGGQTVACDGCTDVVAIAAGTAERIGLKPSVLDKIKDQVLKEIREL